MINLSQSQLLRIVSGQLVMFLVEKKIFFKRAFLNAVKSKYLWVIFENENSQLDSQFKIEYCL